MRADIHDGQERKRSIQGPDTEAQDQPSPDHHSQLATHGRSIQNATTELLHRSKRPTERDQLCECLIGEPTAKCHATTFFVLWCPQTSTASVRLHGSTM